MKLALVKSEEPVNPNEEPENGITKMSFLEHLEELRHRLVRIAIYIGAGFLVSFCFRSPLFHFISAPILPFLTGKKLSYMGVD